MEMVTATETETVTETALEWVLVLEVEERVRQVEEALLASEAVDLESLAMKAAQVPAAGWAWELVQE